MILKESLIYKLQQNHRRIPKLYVGHPDGPTHLDLSGGRTPRLPNAILTCQMRFKASTVRTPVTVIDANRARPTQMSSRLLLCVALD